MTVKKHRIKQQRYHKINETNKNRRRARGGRRRKRRRATISDKNIAKLKTSFICAFFLSF
jgi:hypothetical protein